MTTGDNRGPTNTLPEAVFAGEGFAEFYTATTQTHDFCPVIVPICVLKSDQSVLIQTQNMLWCSSLFFENFLGCTDYGAAF